MRETALDGSGGGPERGWTLPFLMCPGPFADIPVRSRRRGEVSCVHAVAPAANLQDAAPSGSVAPGLSRDNSDDVSRSQHLEVQLTKTPNNSPATQQESEICIRLCGGTSSGLGVHAANIRGIADPCSEIFYNGVSSTSLVSFDANITAVGNGTATATIIFFNAANSTTTFTVTSTATGASSTLKATCRHAGV